MLCNLANAQSFPGATASSSFQTFTNFGAMLSADTPHGMVGYYTDGNPSSVGPVGPITRAGATAINIVDLASFNLNTINCLFLDEASPTTTLLNRLPAIESWVNAGGEIIIHDRAVLNPNPLLLGVPGAISAHATGNDIDVIPASDTSISAGPFGAIGNTNLDGGSYSTHGYVQRATLPADANCFLSYGPNTNKVVAFSYPLGNGFVYYSTIPLDFYLDGSGFDPFQQNVTNIYAPNVTAYMLSLSTVPTVPFITGQPQNQTVAIGSTVSLKVIASGGSLGYQWSKDGTILRGATNLTYTITNVRTNDAGVYSVVISNSLGWVTSSNAVLTVVPTLTLGEVLDAPQLTWNTGGSAPWIGQSTNTYDGNSAAQSGLISAGQDTWLETTVQGPGAVTFWWKVSSESGCDFLQFQINGAIITQISGTIGWSWISNRVAAGSQTLRWRYMKDGTVDLGMDKGWVDQMSFVPDPPAPPTITVQPQSQSASLGSPVSFTVSVTGTQPFSYQWRKDGARLDGQTNSTFAIAGIQTNDTGAYSVVISNSVGWVTSSTALLTLAEPVLDHFAWGELATTQSLNHPFPVSLTALDAFGNTVTKFTGPVTLSGLGNGYLTTNTIIGSPLNVSSNFATYTLGYGFTPNTNLTVTHVRSFYGTKISIWTDAGALLASQTVSGPNGTWTETALPTPIVLVAGTTYRVSCFVGAGEYYWIDNKPTNFANGTLADGFYYTSTDGFPSSFIAGSSSLFLCDLRYTANLSTPVSISPSVSGVFVDGVWSGNLQVQQALTNVMLAASDGSGHQGLSHPFLVDDSSPAPPAIIAQPENRRVTVNETTTFSVTASGTGLTYQWQKDGSSLEGQTNSIYTIVNAQTNDAGAYSVVVTNSLGSLTSSNAILTVVLRSMDTFQITALFTNNSRVVDHDAVTGDDRGGIAVSPSQVFITGDNSTARFDAADLTGGVSLGRIADALCMDLRTETVYSLGNSSTALNSSGGTVTSLIELNGTTGLPTGRVLPLTQSFFMPSSANGIFSGYGRVVVHNGTRVYDISIPSGNVTDRGTMASPLWYFSESWSIWGVAEYFDDTLYLTYHDSTTSRIVRSRVPDGLVTTVATFSNLADMASFTVSPSRNRWYFHYEGSGQFGGTSETLGYADAQLIFYNTNPPAITSQPVSETVVMGGVASFSVSVIGAMPMRYQWQKDGVSLADATNYNYTIANVQTNDAGVYSLVATNSLGSVTSSNAILTVIPILTIGEALDAPQLTWNTGGNASWIGQTTNTFDGIDAAQSGLISASQNTWMETTVQGPGTVTFVWKVSSESCCDFLQFRSNGIVVAQISGSTAWSMVTNRVADGAQTLGWRYSKDGSVNSGMDRGWVDEVRFVPDGPTPPAIAVQPWSQSIALGGPVSFNVVAIGTGPLSYQWLKDGASLDGQTNSTLAIARIQSNDTGAYSVVVSNALGSVTSSNALLTLAEPVLDRFVWGPIAPTNSLNIPFPVSVTAQDPFGNIITNFSGQVSLSCGDGVLATNSLLGSHDLVSIFPTVSGGFVAGAWTGNIQVQQGATNLVLLANDNSGHIGISNPFFVDDTGPAPPAIISHPQSQSVVTGKSVRFTVTASGSALAYQWRKDGASLDGETNSVFTIANVQASNAGAYSVVVSNSLGSISSSNAVLTVIDLNMTTFQITGLFTNHSRVVDHDALTGDDRGGIAVSPDQVFITGDNSTARFNAADLTGGTSLFRISDALCSDLRSETVYSLGNGATALTSSGGLVTTLIELNGTNGQPTGTVLPLSSSFNMGTYNNGIFAGYGRIVVHNGDHVFDISLPSATVTDLGPMPRPNWQYSESWSIWGVAECFDGSLFLTYHELGTQRILRSRIPDGLVFPVATFSILSDMASFTVSTSRNRWYFHYELSGQFGGTFETLGYADAQFNFVSTNPPAILSQPASQIVSVGSMARFDVLASGSPPIFYQWQKDGMSLDGATNSFYMIAVARTNDAGAYSVCISNRFGSVISTSAVLTFPEPVLHHFAWSQIATNQQLNRPFPVSLTAQDASGNTVSHFNGTVSLYGSRDGNLTSNTLLGSPSSLTSGTGTYTIGYAFTPDTILTVTHVRSYSGTKVSIWTDAGILLASQNVNGPDGQWTETRLTTPLVLAPGITYRVAFYTGGGTFYWNTARPATFPNGTLVNGYYYTSADGFPSSFAAGASYNYLCDLRYEVGSRASLSINPTVSGNFVNGVWSGNLQVQQPATNVTLQADDGSAHFGLSNPFNVDDSTPAPPAIISQPQSLRATLGQSAAFSVTASGTALSYQWQKDGASLDGQTNSIYTIANLQTNHAGVYSVIVSNALGSVTSSNASLTVSTTVIVAVFDDSRYVDTAGTVNSESDLVQASLVSLGFEVLPFTNIIAAAAANSVLLFPEQEIASLGPNLTAVERAAVSNFVSSGGLMIIHGSDTTTRSADLINTLFGFAVREGKVVDSMVFSLTAMSQGTAFDGAQAVLQSQNGSDFLFTDSLPAGALSIYQTNNQSLVAELRCGSGKIVFLGWDWWNAAPLGFQDGGWLSILECAVLEHGPLGPRPPVIFAQPVNQRVEVGSSATFSVTASGTAPVSYFWQRDGNLLAQTSLPYYTFTNCQLSDSSSQFSCLVSNDYGSVQSSNATLTVVIPLALGEAVDAAQLTWSTGGNALWVGQTTNTYDGIDAAQSGTISANQDTWVETTVQGPGLLTFMWKTSSQPGYDFLEFRINGNVVTRISGYTSWGYISSRIADGPQTLRWRFTNGISFDPTADRGWLDNVNYVQDTPTPPAIIVQPQPSSVPLGAPAHFGVDAVGTGSLAYQWWKDGAPLNGQTNSLFTITRVQTNDPGTYWVVITNSVGAVVSSNVLLTLAQPVLDHFAWGQIAAQQLNHPFTVSLTALDPYSNTVTSFTGSVTLGGLATLGRATNTLLPSPTSVSSNFNSSTLGYGFVPNTNLTVTHVRSYSGSKVSIWTDTGVLLASQNVHGPDGVWTETPLSTPLELTGGITYRVTFYTGGGAFYWAPRPSTFPDGTLLNGYYFAYGDNLGPLYPSSTMYLCDLRYTVGTVSPASISPAISGIFVNGAWTGDLQVQQPSTSVILQANDGSGHEGTSNPFIVDDSIPAPPAIVTQPQSLRVFANRRATLSVTASGTALGYQWRKDGVILDGATNSTYSIANAQTNQSGIYSVVVSNSLGSITSTNALLMVDVVMVVEVFDNPLYVDTAGTLTSESDLVQASLASFNFDAEPFTNIVAAAVANSIILVPEQEIAPLAPDLTAAERCALSNFVSAGGLMIIHGSYQQSNSAALLNRLFGFAVQEYQVDNDVQFSRSARAAGTAFTNGPAALPSQSGCNILLTSSLPQGSRSIYEVNGQSLVAEMYFGTGKIIFLGWDWCNSAPQGTLDGGWLTVLQNAVFERGPIVPQAPVIFVQPTDQLINAGDSVTFHVPSSGTAPLSYFWQRDGALLAQTSSSDYTITNCQLSDSGSRFSCLVSNACGTVLSSNALLTVVSVVPLGEALDAPELTWTTGGDARWLGQTTNSTDGIDATESGLIHNGQETWIETTVNGSGILTFWWRVSTGPGCFLEFQTNGVTVAQIFGNVGWTSASVRIAGGAQTLRWRYSKSASSNSSLDRGWLDSVNYVSDGPIPPIITAQPQSQILASGQSVTFAVSAIGPEPFNFQWLKDGARLTGQTNSSLSITSIQTNNTGIYSVVIANPYGSVTSSNAVLSVINSDENQFRITGLFTNNSQVIDHNNLTGDDRGGIAVSASHVFYSGDVSTAGFALGDLSGGASLGTIYNALASDLKTEQIYTLGTGAIQFGDSGGVVTSLIALDGTTLQPTGARVDLSQSVTMRSGGIFSGMGRIVLWDGNRVYDILLPSGTVRDLGALTLTNYVATENWVIWGVAENWAGSVSLVYVADSQTIVRTRVPDGLTSPVGVFSDLSDMACFTVSLSHNRWYFHHEFGSQFGGTEETLGYADATFQVSPITIPRVTLRASSIHDGRFRFDFTGEAGQRFDVLTSTNLLDWTWAGALTNTTGITTFGDDLGASGQRFYRLLLKSP